MYKIFGTSEETKNDLDGILIDETEEILFVEMSEKKEAIETFEKLYKKMKNNELFEEKTKSPIVYICLKEDKKIIKEKSLYKIKKSGKKL